MADIKQAAKWIEQGRTVTRHDGYLYQGNEIEEGLNMFQIVCLDEDTREELVGTMFTDDILAEDWEIAE